MTFAERVHGVTTLGFLERHARFVVTVLLHGGVCLGRQYCTFAGIKRGQVMHDFFANLVSRGVATAYPRSTTHSAFLAGSLARRRRAPPARRSA